MTAPGRSLWRDPRIGLGVLITLLAVAWSLRGIDLAAFGAALASAKLGLVVPGSLACHAAALGIRSLRWRHLAAGVGPLPLRVAYRATAIRFMGNNLFPFRLGELAGAWFAARDAGGSPAAWFGTIVLERAFDMAAVMSLAAFLLIGHIEVPPLLRVLAFVPILGIAALRIWPRVFLGVAGALLARLPGPLGARARGLLEHVAAGLSGIRDVRGLALVLLHTAVLWGGAATLPFYLAQHAFGIELGSFAADYVAALQTMVGVGIAVALPQAPGFVGVYHFACREILTALGVPGAMALAVGTLAHALFWLSITALGLLALRGSRASLAEAVQGASAGGDPKRP